jgi:vitamin B12 transporter
MISFYLLRDLGHNMKRTFLAKRIALLCISTPLITPIATAQDSNDVDETYTYVYSVNRFEQPKTSVLASTSTIEREEIEKLSANSALDVLKTLAGVEVNTQGTRGNSTSVYIRGTNSNQTVVLLNGVKLNSPTGGASNLGLIPAFAIEKIEVIRGPRATVYGADAIGGVISISTLPQHLETVHEATLAGGSNYYNQQGFRSSGQISESTHASFIVNNESDKGFYINTVAPEEDSFGYGNQTLFGSLTHTLSDQWLLGFNAYGNSNVVEYAGSNPTTWAYEKAITTQEFYSLAGHLDYRNDQFHSSLQYNLTNDVQGSSDEAQTRAAGIISAKRHTLSWLNTYYANQNFTVNAGIDHSQEQADQGGSNSLDFAESNKTNSAIFATALSQLNALTTELGVRFDDNSAFGQHTTWSAAAGYYLPFGVELTASYGTAFRAPTFNDLYWPEDPYGVGNPDLKPETSQSAELGLAGEQSLLSWQVALYKTDIQDLIDWQPVDENNQWGQWTPTNVEDATIKGVELNLGFDTGTINHAVVADYKDPKNVESGEQLVRRAKQNYSWTANYQLSNVNFALATKYTGERLDSSGDMLEAYTVVDFATRYQVTDALKLQLRVDNLFDEEYKTAYHSKDAITSEKYYYLGTERSFYAGLNYRF